jgi:ankyrin repeat protein
LCETEKRRAQLRAPTAQTPQLPKRMGDGGKAQGCGPRAAGATAADAPAVVAAAGGVGEADMQRGGGVAAAGGVDMQRGGGGMVPDDKDEDEGVEERYVDTKLWLATAGDDNAAFNALIKTTPDVNAVGGKADSTALHKAIENENIMMVKTLLAHKKIDVDARDNRGRTPLIQAAWYSGPTIIRMLVRKGASVNAACKRGGTALMASAAEGEIDSVKYLLENGADVDATTDAGNTPLHGIDDDRIVNILATAGANVSAKNVDGETPLHMACREGFTDACMALMRAGVDVDVVSVEGYTAFDEASFSEFPVLAAEVSAGSDRQAMEKQRRVAFAMGTHTRIGEASNVALFAGNTGLLRTMLHECAFEPVVSSAVEVVVVD